MKNTIWLCLAFLLMLAHAALGQKPSDNVLRAIEEAEDKMFRSVNYTHAQAYFATDVTDDFFTINADGVIANKAAMLADTARLKMFEAATLKRFDRKIRVYGEVAVTNGRGQAYHNNVMVAEFLYTTVFVFKNGKWMYAGWQGTYTKNSPPVPQQ